MKSFIIMAVIIITLIIIYKTFKTAREKKMEKLAEEMRQRINLYARKTGKDYYVVQNSISGKWSPEDLAVLEAADKAEIDELPVTKPVYEMNDNN